MVSLPGHQAASPKDRCPDARPTNLSGEQLLGAGVWLLEVPWEPVGTWWPFLPRAPSKTEVEQGGACGNSEQDLHLEWLDMGPRSSKPMSLVLSARHMQA